jgi:hypothetical protein
VYREEELEEEEDIWYSLDQVHRRKQGGSSLVNLCPHVSKGEGGPFSFLKESSVIRSIFRSFFNSKNAQNLHKPSI